jgi:hypothetical protein
MNSAVTWIDSSIINGVARPERLKATVTALEHP